MTRYPTRETGLHSEQEKEAVEAFGGQPLVLRPQTLIEEYDDINLLAPLVRCSKLPFRQLVSGYQTHITNTPMILAEEFSRSQTGRLSDFSTSLQERGLFWVRRRDRRRSRDENDDTSTSSSNEHGRSVETDHLALDSRPLPYRHLGPRPSANHDLVRGLVLAQFASPNGKAMAEAVELISVRKKNQDGEDTGERLVDGVDLNCGCPQPWAYAEGIGSGLLRKPEVVADIIRAVKDRMGWNYDISVKIRVDQDLKLTDVLVKNAIHAGATHLTIHGRTRKQASKHPVSLDAIAFAVESAQGQVPCVGNGDIWDLNDAQIMRTKTGVKGVMAARGLLANPALFAGYQDTPNAAIEEFTSLCIDYGLQFSLYQKHIAYMIESRLRKPDRMYVNGLFSYAGVMDALEDFGMINAK